MVVVGACVGWKCGRWVIWLTGVIFMLETVRMEQFSYASG